MSKNQQDANHTVWHLVQLLQSFLSFFADGQFESFGCYLTSHIYPVKPSDDISTAAFCQVAFRLGNTKLLFMNNHLAAHAEKMKAGDQLTRINKASWLIGRIAVLLFAGEFSHWLIDSFAVHMHTKDYISIDSIWLYILMHFDTWIQSHNLPTEKKNKTKPKGVRLAFQERTESMHRILESSPLRKRKKARILRRRWCGQFSLAQAVILFWRTTSRKN